MDRKLHLKAATAVKDVYAGNCHNIGSTEWASTIIEHQGERVQILAIGGSNELVDWFWNLFPGSWDGVKIYSYLSAHLIDSGTWGDFEWLRKGLGAIRKIVVKGRHEAIPQFSRVPGIPLLVAAHSKSGPTGVYFKHKFGADLCIAFCPARGFSKPVSLSDTVMYIDPDDPVPKLGKKRFDHPECQVVTLPNEPGWKIGDHFIDHLIEYLKFA